MAMVEEPFTHVVDVFPEDVVIPGQNKAADGKIAEWCAENQRVLVTVDSDFSGRWLRTGLLAQHGVEVIVFMKDIEGLSLQYQLIAKHLPMWQALLRPKPYGYRVWDQPLNRSLRERTSKHRTY